MFLFIFIICKNIRNVKTMGVVIVDSLTIIVSAIAGLLGIVAKALFDMIVNKQKAKLETDATDKELMMKEYTSFRQEMRDEIRVLRAEVTQLREENFQLRAQNSRLVLRISELEEELRVMRKIAGYDNKDYNIISIDNGEDNEKD
jgi:predicted nuclease with TOPRIM domain